VLTGSLTNIVIPPNLTTPAKATTSGSVQGNLDSSAPTITAADTANPTAAELADPANAQSVMQTTVGVYDSVGNKHDLTLVAWKTGPSTWDFKIDPTGLNYDNTKPSNFGPGHFTFDANGALDLGNSTLPTISFTPQGTGAALSIKIDPGAGGAGLTSFNGATTAVLRNQDGYAAGVLQRTSIGKDGTITGAFSNGTTQTLGQIALADFNNPQGLETTGDNMYVVSANSGPAVVGYSGRETVSTIASGALEMSNVDLAQQFTDMIITQRGFQANGKMITTSDQMLQDLVNMVR
jgi:flagellar hook protein FlgE